jgi:hypothetical protein
MLPQWLSVMQQQFPLLTMTNFRITSPADQGYNCIAWAADDPSRWWWPDPLGQCYWPPEARREVTLEAFLQAYQLHGYADRSDPQLEPTRQKVAIYTSAAGVPTHAARQLPDGWWASKLGPQIDIEHELGALDGPAYGRVAVILARSARREG